MTVTIRNIKQMGECIARIRHSQNMTQKGLGEKADLRQATISALENGEVDSRLQTLFDILAALNLEIIVQPRPDDKYLDRLLHEMFE